MGFNTYFGPSPFDFFYYRPYYGYYNTPIRQRGDPEEMGWVAQIGDGSGRTGEEEGGKAAGARGGGGEHTTRIKGKRTRVGLFRRSPGFCTPLFFFFWRRLLLLEVCTIIVYPFPKLQLFAIAITIFYCFVVF